jgi:diguanylate cyclase (GGDEF)-like protein
MMSSFVLIILLFTLFLLANQSNDVSINQRLYQLAFMIVLVIVFSLVYHRYMTHATNTFLIWIITYLLYLQEFANLQVFTAMFVMYFLFRVTAVYNKQIIVLSVVSVILLIRQIVLDTGLYQDNMIQYQTYVASISSTLFVLFICVFIYFLIKNAQKEIEKADRIMSESTIDFVLKTQNRRVTDTSEKINYVSVLLIGINDISIVNDELSYPVTEILLKEVISVIRETVRIDDYILRWDQDEFLVMLHNTPLSNSTIVAEKIRKAIEFHGFTEQKYRITVTICASHKNPEERIQDTVLRAQNGIKTAKIQKKNYVLIP